MKCQSLFSEKNLEAVSPGSKLFAQSTLSQYIDLLLYSNKATGMNEVKDYI